MKSRFHDSNAFVGRRIVIQMHQIFGDIIGNFDK